jgi:hypothetical protein
LLNHYDFFILLKPISIESLLILLFSMPFEFEISLPIFSFHISPSPSESNMHFALNDLRRKLYTGDTLVQAVYIPLASNVQTVSGTSPASYMMEIA